MNIAVIISGHIRCLSETKSSLVSTFIDGLNADIYIHTWQSSDMIENTWRSSEIQSYNQYDRFDTFKELRPVGLLIENQKNIEVPLEISNAISKLELSQQSVAIGTWWMLYGMTKGYELVREKSLSDNKRYDIVLRYRFDMLAPHFSTFKRDIRNHCEHTVIAPKHEWATSFGSVSDTYILAGYDNYGTIIKHLNNNFTGYVERCSMYSRFIPEVVISNAIYDSGMKMVNSCGNHKILRASGEVINVSGNDDFSINLSNGNRLFCWSLIENSLVDTDYGLYHESWERSNTIPIKYVPYAMVHYKITRLAKKIKNRFMKLLHFCIQWVKS